MKLLRLLHVDHFLLFLEENKEFMLTRDDLIYVAGLMDTAAYITIKKMRGEVAGPLISFRVSIGPKGINLIKGAYGGYMNRESLVLNPGSVWKLLDDVYPFLRNRKEHADILVDFRASVEEFKYWKKGKSPKTGLPERMRKDREKYWKKMKALNDGEGQVSDEA